jgi:hypothetical protein
MGRRPVLGGRRTVQGYPDTIHLMHRVIARLGSALGRDSEPLEGTSEAEARACSWEAMRAVYQEQAARGEPEAIRGLERIEQGRWPTSGRPRQS